MTDLVLVVQVENTTKCSGTRGVDRIPHCRKRCSSEEHGTYTRANQQLILRMQLLHANDGVVESDDSKQRTCDSHMDSGVSLHPLQSVTSLELKTTMWRQELASWLARMATTHHS